MALRATKGHEDAPEFGNGINEFNRVFRGAIRNHRPGSSRPATRLDRHSGRLRFRTLRSYVDQVMVDIVTAADGKVILPSGSSWVRATMRPEYLLFIRRSPGCIPVSRCHCARRR